LLIETHYERLRIKKRWDKKRLERLCGYLQVTKYELASLVGVPHTIFDWRYSIGKLSTSAYLMLTILESRYLKEYVKDTIQDLFNFYGRPRCTETNGNDATKVA
jgi:hypothetical protein